MSTSHAIREFASRSSWSARASTIWTVSVGTHPTARNINHFFILPSVTCLPKVTYHDYVPGSVEPDCGEACRLQARIEPGQIAFPESVQPGRGVTDSLIVDADPLDLGRGRPAEVIAHLLHQPSQTR